MAWETGDTVATNIIQKVVIDENNSSETNLDSSNSYTFTGTGTKTLGVNGLQWSLITDQNATVYIDQSPDNINWDVTYHYDYIALEGGQGDLITDSVFYHLAGNAGTHVLKYGAGKLQKIIYNNTSGTSLTIYDGIDITGAIIGIITTASAALGTWIYDVSFSNGLTLVTVGNSLDATIVYE